MRHLALSSSLLLAASACAAPSSDEEAAAPPPLASTLAKWRHGRFGLFIHWGLYSLAEGEWKGSTVAGDGPWKGKGFTEFLQLQARIPVAEYEEFARGFRPGAFDADTWVRDAKAAGMRYLVFTAKHHEGFAMFGSPSHRFNLVDHSGVTADPVAELAAACRRHGLLFGVYYSLGRDWHDPDAPTYWPVKGGRSNTWDFPDEDSKVFDRYFRRKVLPQVRELMTQYGPVDILWFDTPERITAAQSAELLRMVRALQPGCVVNDRVGNAMGDYATYEQKVPPAPVASPWETCATLGRNWSFNPRDTQWKTPEQIVRLLTDVVAKDGNLLFNVSPRGDGSWPAGVAAHLKQVGDWLVVNGPAIYGARAWRMHTDAVVEQTESAAAAPPGTPTSGDTIKNEINHEIVPDLRFTVSSNGALNVIARSWQADTVLVRELGLAQPAAPRVVSARLLGSSQPVAWTQTEDSLLLHFPSHQPEGIPVWVFHLEIVR